MVLAPFGFNIALIILSACLTGWIKGRVQSHFGAEETYTGRELPDYAKKERLGNLAVWASDLGTIFGTVAVAGEGLVLAIHMKANGEGIAMFGVAAVAFAVFSVVVTKTHPTGGSKPKRRVVLFLVLGIGINAACGTAAYFLLW